MDLRLVFPFPEVPGDTRPPLDGTLLPVANVLPEHGALTSLTLALFADIVTRSCSEF